MTGTVGVVVVVPLLGLFLLNRGLGMIEPLNLRGGQSGIHGGLWRSGPLRAQGMTTVGGDGSTGFWVSGGQAIATFRNLSLEGWGPWKADANLPGESPGEIIVGFDIIIVLVAIAIAVIIIVQVIVIVIAGIGRVVVFRVRTGRISTSTSIIATQQSAETQSMPHVLFGIMMMMMIVLFRTSSKQTTRKRLLLPCRTGRTVCNGDSHMAELTQLNSTCRVVPYTKTTTLTQVVIVVIVVITRYNRQCR